MGSITISADEARRLGCRPGEAAASITFERGDPLLQVPDVWVLDVYQDGQRAGVITRRASEWSPPRDHVKRVRRGT